MIGFGGEFGGARKQEVTRQHSGGRRPARIQGGHASAEQSAIDQVIMDEGGGVQKFNCRTEGDEFIEGRIQHISDEQAKGGSDSFSACRKQMLQCGAQIGMAFIRLHPHSFFNEFDFLCYW